MKEPLRHKTVCDMPYFLLHFLIIHSALSKYLGNLVKDKRRIRNWKSNPRSYIRFYFIWSNSNEGFNYWRDLNKLYLEAYEKHILL